MTTQSLQQLRTFWGFTSELVKFLELTGSSPLLPVVGPVVGGRGEVHPTARLPQVWGHARRCHLGGGGRHLGGVPLGQAQSWRSIELQTAP